MNEIEKMYENAGVELKKYCQNCERLKSDMGGDFRIYIYCDSQSESPETCPYAKGQYPPFTAEKQIELIKTIERECDLIDCIQIVYRPMEDLWKISIIPVLEMAFEEMYLYFGCDKDFSTALAMAINNLWQDLTKTEQEKIRKILKG